MAKLYTRKSDGTYVPNNPQSVTNIDVVQTTGDSVTAAMSQDAVTKELATKQSTLTAGNGISIEGNEIGMTTITESESQPNSSLWINPSEDTETDVTYNRSQIDAMLGAKQDALQLTVKDNGNIVLSNIQGQSKEFMPATPSGDPMHYAYEAAGAEWNGTGADIIKTAPWADMVDDEADKTVVHKAGYWYLNGLGDITTEQMRMIYNEKDNNTFFSNSFRQIKQKTNIPILTTGTYIDANCVGYGNRAQVLFFDGEVKMSNIYAGFRYSYNLQHILGIFSVDAVSKSSNIELFLSICPKLISVKISKIKINLNLSTLPMLSCKSILYMIQNEIATTVITITLHADAYARAMANADIVAALEAHPNVSLASA